MQIQGWDYATSNCQSGYSPIFYIIPDDSWVYYTRINGPLHVPVAIDGTGLYDGSYWVRVDRQPDTLWHIGFIPIDFTGYPGEPGTCSLRQIDDAKPSRRRLGCIDTACC